MTYTRKRLMKEIQKIMGESFPVRTTEEFDGQTEGIWTSGEHEGKDGLHFADYYSMSTHPKIEKLLENAGWFYEWHDAGTIMIYEN